MTKVDKSTNDVLTDINAAYVASNRIVYTLSCDVAIDQQDCSEYSDSTDSTKMTCLIGYDVSFAVREITPACIETSLSSFSIYYTTRLVCCSCIRMGQNILFNTFFRGQATASASHPPLESQESSQRCQRNCQLHLQHPYCGAGRQHSVESTACVALIKSA